jgi:prophage antirepressor-like protein
MDLIMYGYNGRLLTIIQDDKGNPWWVANEVCDILNLGNPRSTLALLDNDEKGVHNMDTRGGKQDVTIINEPGLYSLIFRSKKPEAKAFKHWVTHEVLPSIRKTGYYRLDDSEEKEAGAKRQRGRPRKTESDSGYDDILKRQRQLSQIFENAFKLARRITQSNKDAAEIARAKVEELTGVNLSEYLKLPPGMVSDGRTEEKLLDSFIGDCCIIGDEYWARASDLYQTFRDWFLNNRPCEAPTQKWFGARIGRRFNRKKDGVYKYLGIGLKSQPTINAEGLVRDFADDCCSFGTDYRSSLNVLYERFGEYYQNHTGQVPLPFDRFKEVLRGSFSLVPDGEDILAGIRLLPVAKAEA